MKFDEQQTQLLPRGLYSWRRQDEPGAPLYQLQRDAREGLNRWNVVISIDGCTTQTLVPQDVEEDLLDDILIEVPVFSGVCDDDQPILNLRLQMYRTIAAALLDYPDLQNWVWPPY